MIESILIFFKSWLLKIVNMIKNTQKRHSISENREKSKIKFWKPEQTQKILLFLFLSLFLFFLSFLSHLPHFSLPDLLSSSTNSSTPKPDPATLGVDELPSTEPSPRRRLSHHKNMPNDASQMRVPCETRASPVLHLGWPLRHRPRAFSSSPLWC